MPGELNLYLSEFWVLSESEDFAGRITSNWSRVYPEYIGEYPEYLWGIFPKNRQLPPIKGKLDYLGKVMFINNFSTIKIREPEGKTFVFHRINFSDYRKYRINDKLNIVIPRVYCG